MKLVFRPFLLLLLIMVIIGCDFEVGENEEKTLGAFLVIDEVLESNNGVLNLEELSIRDDWEQFCLVQAYSYPKNYFINGVDRLSQVEKLFPDINEDRFGVGIIFADKSGIIDYVQVPAYTYDSTKSIGDNIERINGLIQHIKKRKNDAIYKHLPGLKAKSDIPSQRPGQRCYEKNITIKIGADWTYGIIGADEGSLTAQ